MKKRPGLAHLLKKRTCHKTVRTLSSLCFSVFYALTLKHSKPLVVFYENNQERKEKFKRRPRRGPNFFFYKTSAKIERLHEARAMFLMNRQLCLKIGRFFSVFREKKPKNARPKKNVFRVWQKNLTQGQKC